MLTAASSEGRRGKGRCKNSQCRDRRDRDYRRHAGRSIRTGSSAMLDGEGDGDFHDNKFGWTCLLGERRGGPDVSVYAAPARAEDLTGLPSSYIDVGGVETFRDEAILYATRLLQAGVSVDLHVWAGGFHGYDFMAPDAAISQRTEQVRSEYIHRALRG
jgi:acetyl esterase/lipase